MDPLQHLPLTTIDPFALLRDRTTLDPAALQQLQHSIATEGLRAPIEVWALSTPRPSESGDTYLYGLISGLRRLTACAVLGHTTIPAVLRSPQSVAQALTAMVTKTDGCKPVIPGESVGKTGVEAWPLLRPSVPVKGSRHKSTDSDT
jgi:ParB family transcriptional regulator, chromosome partitioning protein